MSNENTRTRLQSGRGENTHRFIDCDRCFLVRSYASTIGRILFRNSLRVLPECHPGSNAVIELNLSHEPMIYFSLMLSKDDVIAKVELCRRVLTDYKFLCDAPLVSFFYENQWNFVQCKGWHDYLLALSDVDLACLPDPNRFTITDDTPRSLAKLIEDCRDISRSFAPYTSLGLHEETMVGLGMSPKKQHEVSNMSNVVRCQVASAGIDQIIDFGSGKGYLPENVALTTPHVRVIGLDREEVNTKGGTLRNELMDKQWLSLNKKLNPERKQQNRPLNHYLPITLELSADHVSYSFVNSVAALADGHIMTGSRTMLLGLHACGDLTSLLLHIFLKCPDLKCIVSVGCCYHLITQREKTLSYMTEGCHKEKLSDPSSVHAYPLSEYLQQLPIYFTRNALNLAQQAPEKMASNGNMPARNLFFRAVFQVLLFEVCEDPSAQNVGHSATRETNFLAYTKAAFSKLEIEHNMSDSDVMSLFTSFNQLNERQLYVFYQLRTLLARVIECVVLLDRVLYLHDNGVDSNVFSLFDPIVSPRCFAIVATKGSQM